jgi:hypothetical protein
LAVKVPPVAPATQIGFVPEKDDVLVQLTKFAVPAVEAAVSLMDFCVPTPALKGVVAVYDWVVVVPPVPVQS